MATFDNSHLMTEQLAVNKPHGVHGGEKSLQNHLQRKIMQKSIITKVRGE
jgi:hypothetical protein